MRHNRGNILILFILLCLGLFFQNQRSEGFLKMFKNTNFSVEAKAMHSLPDAAESWPGDQFLLVYDRKNGESLRLAFNIEKTLQQIKKDVKIIPVEAIAQEKLNYAGVILAFSDLDKLKNFEPLHRYVADGGNVYFMITPNGNMFTEIQKELGIKSSGDLVTTPGIKVLSNILIKGKGFVSEKSSIENSSYPVELDEQSRLHITSYEGVPLLWERNNGKGSYVVYNGTSLQVKDSRGVITGMLGIGLKTFAYPVIGIKMMYLDDFPAPVPEGTSDAIYPDYHLTTPEFYRQIWWPDMLKLAARYNVKYTGVVIETYGNKVDPPFAPEANNGANRNHLILYGRELLKSGGELGVHGYNHQPLVPPGFARHTDYQPWTSVDAMTKSIGEVKRYIGEVYPDYKLRVYVPPSNILSPEGRKALVQALPDLHVISSVYVGHYETDNSYAQEYDKGPDGVLHMPRISSNYFRDKDDDWSIINGISFLGVFCHFVHPDNIFYPENKGRHWEEFYKGLESLFKDIAEKYNWLRACTASQGAEYFEDFLRMNYRLKLDDNQLQIACGGFRDDSYFVLRTPRKIIKSTGCDVQSIDENVYLLKIHSSKVSLLFESEVRE